MKNAYELAENILKSKPDKNIELKSSDSFASIELYGTSACKKVQDTEFCECFHLENESGTGMITLYHVFPGIDLVYNDMHMEYCNKEQKPASSVMEINYCMEVLPLDRSYGDSSIVTLSPGRIRIKFIRNLPLICASTTCLFSSSTLNIALGSFSRTVPSTSITSAFDILNLLYVVQLFRKSQNLRISVCNKNRILIMSRKRTTQSV